MKIEPDNTTGNAEVKEEGHNQTKTTIVLGHPAAADARSDERRLITQGDD